MIKDGRGKTKRVDTVENAAVPVDKLAVVADALVALDRAHRHIAGKSHGGNNHARKSGLTPIRKRREIDERHRDKSGRKGSEERAFRRLARIDVRSNFMSRKRAGPEILRHVVNLRQKDKDKQKSQVSRVQFLMRRGNFALRLDRFDVL